MKSEKFLTTLAFRLLALVLCLTASIPQMQAQTYTVAGTANGVLGTSNNWNVIATANDMTRYQNTNYYYLIKSGNLTNQTGDWYGFKIVTNHSWSNSSYPSDNYYYNVPSNGTYTCVFAFNTDGNKVSLTGPFQTLTAVGDDTNSLGSSWNPAESNNDMTSSDGGITYHLIKSNVTYASSGNFYWKIATNHVWDHDGLDMAYPLSGNNETYSIPSAGTYDVDFTFNTITQQLTVDLQSSALTTYTYDIYVRYKGDDLANVKLHAWEGTNTNLTGNWPGVNINSFQTVTVNGHTYYHTTLTSYYSTIGVILSMNGSPQTGNLTANPGDNYITYDGQTTATCQSTPDPAIVYYVVGDEALIGHNWATGSDVVMTNNSWTKTGIHLNIGTYNLKVLDSEGNWYGDSNGNNVSVTAPENGTYTLTVTRDPNSGVVSATLNRTAIDATQTYNIYVRYTGNESLSNVYTHAWNSAADYDTYPGIKLSEMSTETINGHTYYKYTINTTASSIGLLFNENGSNSTQTESLTAQPGNSYFTYGGGSTISGPNSQADEPTPTYNYTIYVRYKGTATPHMHLWDASGDKLGSFPGTALTNANTFTTEVINGYTYYKYIVTESNYSSMGMILSEGSAENKTSDLEVEPGTSYWTYGGGSIIYGPNSQADPAITTYYAATDIHSWVIDEGSLMTYNSSDGSYSKTFTGISLTAGSDYGYKVFGANDGTNEGVWIGDSQGNNGTFSPSVSGTYNVTITLNSDGTISHTLTLINAAPIYIEGSEGLGLQWGYAPTTAMTYDTTTGYYTYTYTVEHDGTYNFMFGNGQGSSWDDFNANYRIGPQSGDQAIALDDQWVSTQMAHTDGGSYQINVAAGPVTIYFDPATMKFKVDASAPTYLYTFYIYPSDGTTVPHIYLWDNAQHPYTNAFPGNEVTVTEELADRKTWYKYSETILIDVLNAIISGGGNNADNTKTKDITNFEPGTYYIVWDPVRPNGEAYNHFELYNDPPSAIGDHQLFIHGGYYHEGQTYSYASDSGSEMKYYRNPNNPDEEYYYINNITLSSNATFCFSTQLGNGWENVGVRYGNGGPEYTDNPNGTNYLEVTEAKINTMMPLGPWSGTYGEYKMFTAGVYNVLASPSGGWVKLIKTDHKNLSPMNVYLEQTPNVEISNIQEPGTTYTTAMFDGYWPLSAYNQKQGGWNPNSDSQHYPVTYIGDTTTVDGKHWWHWQVNASIAEVFFSRTNKDPKQSEAIVRHAGVLWVTWDEINGQTVMTDHSREYFEAAANALPTNAVVMEGHYYVYFINTLGWDRVFCYAWDDADGQYTDGYNRVMESWPGHICELVGIDPVTGYEVWRYDLGTISSIDHAPDGILFNDGDTNALSDSKEQTGDFEYINGGVYDYLGLFDGAYTLNNLIRTAAEEVRYTVSNDLLAVYYDPNAKTDITYKNKYGEPDTETIYGALYAKDLNQYGEKSVKPSSLYTDYVYETCPSSHTAGGSQVMVKKTSYDQSNWVKLVMSPNYDGRNPVPLADNDRPELANFVGHIIPAGTLDVFMTDTINPEAHVLAIQMGKSMTYEPNVYISGHFNDTVVFNYTHRDWQPDEYKGNLRTKPVIEWTFVDGENGKEAVKGTATRVLVQEDPYYMYYVAPKPQEIAYITWVVYDNYNTDGSWPGYTHGTYQPYTQDNPLSRPPVDPGRFYAPMNWDRSIEIPGDAYSQLEYLSDNELDKALGAWSSEYGPYSNAYMQYGGIKVNWSLFDNESNGGPWWQIFKPGQAYKFMAIIRYARGSSEGNNTNNYCYKPSIGYFIDGEDHVYQDDGTKFNAPRREEENNPIYANMYHTSYRDLDESKFIIFPIKASAQRSNGSGIGNVTEVKEVIADVNVQRDIVAVRYYNLMGIESDKPFDGINIVVTTYSDGTRTSKKILR